jgi:hypothetical protein
MRLVRRIDLPNSSATDCGCPIFPRPSARFFLRWTARARIEAMNKALAMNVGERVVGALLLAAVAYWYFVYAGQTRPQIPLGERTLVMFTLPAAAIGQLVGRWKGAIVGAVIGFLVLVACARFF